MDAMGYIVCFSFCSFLGGLQVGTKSRFHCQECPV